MKLSRKWLQEFVDIAAVSDRDFAEAMTLSGSKVETTEDLGAEIKNVVVGRIRKMERHPDSDHMWVCRVDAGQNEPVQIVTGAWNIHEGDLVPVALHKALLPGGKKIERGKLRGVLSDGMLCSLSELGLDERDFPYAAIEAAALLNDYHPIDPEKPSIPADIKPGDKVFGPVICAGVANVSSAGDGKWECTLIRTEDDSPCATTLVTDCQNLHQFDLVAYNTKTNAICTLSDLHAEQREFPTASTTASSSSTRTASPETTSSPSSTPTTTWWSLRSPPTAPTACPSSAWPGRCPLPSTRPSPSTSRW